MTRTHDQFLPEGAKIGVYEIKNVLSSDSFSVSYRALNHHMKGQVVLKEYFPQDLAKREKGQQEITFSSPEKQESFEFGLKEFLQQADTLLLIEHPNIVPTENVLQINGTVYLILTHQTGVPLSKLDNTSELFGDTEAKFILTSILQALEKVHEHDMIHGDINPGSILLDKKGEPKLTEFSTARLALAQQTNTLDKELASQYAPREQFDASTNSGPSADFYALGATLLDCMSHAEPTAAKKRMGALKKEGVDPIASQLEALSSSYSADLLETIRWMLELKSSERPQSTNEILSRLSTDSDVKSDTDEPEIIKDDDDDDNSNPSMLKSLVLTGATLGLVGLVAFTFWDKIVPQEGDDLVTNIPNTVAIPPAPDSSELTPNPANIAADVDTNTTAPVESEPENIAEQLNIDPDIGNSNIVVETTEKPASETVPEIVDQLAQSAPDTDTSVIKQQEPTTFTAPLPKVIQQQTTQSQRDQSPDLPVMVNRSVEQYLADAEIAMREYRLTTPINNNAYAFYRAVLATQPDHPKAVAGLKRIVNQYVQLIEKAIRKDNSRNARVYLKRAEKIIPRNAKLIKYREALLER